MSIEKIITQHIERDEQKWTAEAIRLIESEPEWLALVRREADDLGPMTIEERAVHVIATRHETALAKAMYEHYRNETNCASRLAAEIADEVLYDFNWRYEAERWVSAAADRLSESPVAS